MFAYQASHPRSFQQDANMCEVEFSGWLTCAFSITFLGIRKTLAIDEKKSMFNISEMYANTE